MRSTISLSWVGLTIAMASTVLLMGGCERSPLVGDPRQGGDRGTQHPIEVTATPAAVVELPTRSPNSPTPLTPTEPPIAEPTVSPTVEDPRQGAKATFTALPPPTATAIPATYTATAVPPTATTVPPTTTAGRSSPTEPAATRSRISPPGGGGAGGIVVDHRSVDRFDAIPAEYIQAAANLTMFYADRSVGQNLNEALDCLAVPQPEAPNHCKRYNHRDPAYSTTPADVAWSGVYPRNNWQFVGCTGMKCMVDQYASTPTQVFGYFPNYLEGPKLPGRVAETFQPLLDLRAAHPGATLFAMTTSLPRGVETGATDERQMMHANDEIRAWAQKNGIPLLDAADILSHTPGGASCYDNRDGVPYYVNDKQQENLPDDGSEVPAICPHYTTEISGGHLGDVSAGKIRLAKAMWVLMARLAGWPG